MHVLKYKHFLCMLVTCIFLKRFNVFDLMALKLSSGTYVIRELDLYMESRTEAPLERVCHLSRAHSLQDKGLTSASDGLAVVRSFSSSVCMEFSCCSLSFS